MEDAAIKIAVNDLFYIRTEETISTFEPIVIDLFEGFKMILHALVIW